jgi:hypothetical protein
MKVIVSLKETARPVIAQIVKSHLLNCISDNCLKKKINEKIICFGGE